jgi:hypothetical protein
LTAQSEPLVRRLVDIITARLDGERCHL